MATPHRLRLRVSDPLPRLRPDTTDRAERVLMWLWLFACGWVTGLVTAVVLR